MAAYGVGSNILQVVIIPAFGLSMAISILAGQNIGAGNIERAARIGQAGRAARPSPFSPASASSCLPFAPALRRLLRAAAIPA